LLKYDLVTFLGSESYHLIKKLILDNHIEVLWQFFYLRISRIKCDPINCIKNLCQQNLLPVYQLASKKSK